MPEAPTEDIQRSYWLILGSVLTAIAPTLTGWNGLLDKYFDLDIATADNIGKIILFVGAIIVFVKIVGDPKIKPGGKILGISLLILWVLIASFIMLLSGQ